MKRAGQQFIPDVGGLLALYRFWGAAAVASFATLLFLLLVTWQNPSASYPLLVMSLLAGFLWIGSTSISRHSLIRLKDAIGERPGLFEFLSTQFVFILFPYSYRKVKKEVERYTRKG